MSVTGTDSPYGPQHDGYENLVTIQRNQTQNINLPSAGPWEGYLYADPMEDIIDDVNTRQHVLELVSLEWVVWLQPDQGNDPATDIHMVQYALGKNITEPTDILDGMRNPVYVDPPPRQDQTFTARDGSTTTLAVNNPQGYEEASETYLVLAPHQFGRYVDDTNANAAGPTLHMAHGERHFRDMYDGEGPILDPDDELTRHITWDIEGPTDQGTLYETLHAVLDIRQWQG